MERLPFTCARLVAALLLVVGLARHVGATETDPGNVIDTWVPSGASDENLRALNGSYTGFGATATGGEGRAVVAVTSLADNGIGSLRSVLEAVGRLGGGRIVFAVAGDVVLLAELVVPANTTIDGLTAPAPGITLWGDRLSAGGGILEINASNVIVRGLRIRNAANDGIQIAAKRGVAIARVVVDHCSVTNSGDGGIDVTGSSPPLGCSSTLATGTAGARTTACGGSEGAVVRDVTVSWSYLAANGGPCASKEWCGGGSLVKYGVTHFSAHANVWDKNLRRNPSIAGAAEGGGTLADVRGNVVRGYVESGTQLRDGARGNVVGNFFAGDRPLLTAGAFVFAAANEGSLGAGATTATETAPFDVAEPLGALTRAEVLAHAGTPPFDAIDTAYRDELATYAAAKNASPGPASANATLGTDGGLTGATTPPLTPATLADAARALRRGRAARTHGDRTDAVAEYQAVLRLLAGSRGLLTRPAAATMAAAALALSELARDGAEALAFARDALAHARRSGVPQLERRVQRRLERLAR